MSYTVGVKRRFWFGYKTYRVRGHDWANFRFILDLDDGSQISIPGFRCDGIKVYPDFWTHVHALKTATRRQGATHVPQGDLEYPTPAPVYPAPVPVQAQYPEPQPVRPPAPQVQPWLRPPTDPSEERAHQLASERVNSILGGNVTAPQGGPGSFIS